MSYAKTFIEQLAQRGDWKCFAGQHHSINWTGTYAEHQGEDSGVVGVLLGNWNTSSGWNRETSEHTTLCECMPRVAAIAEKAGYAAEWEDEWDTCSSCGKAVRTQPDSYGWRPQFATVGGGCELLCRECVDDNEVIRESIGDSGKSLPEWIEPEEHGYHDVAGDPTHYETGFHPGQNADPQVVADELRACGIKRFVFAIGDVGQFDARWSVYVRTRDLKRARRALGITVRPCVTVSGATTATSKIGGMK